MTGYEHDSDDLPDPTPVQEAALDALLARVNEDLERHLKQVIDLDARRSALSALMDDPAMDDTAYEQDSDLAPVRLEQPDSGCSNRPSPPPRPAGLER